MDEDPERDTVTEDGASFTLNDWDDLFAETPDA